MTKIFGIAFLSLCLAASAQAACKLAMSAQQGIWSLSKGDVACPMKLEVRCVQDAEKKPNTYVFVDEIKPDSTPGAQIYFSKVNGPAINLPSDLVVDEKEYSGYSKQKGALVSFYKECKLILGCWGAYKIRHQMHFTPSAISLDTMWGQEMSCLYKR